MERTGAGVRSAVAEFDLRRLGAGRTLVFCALIYSAAAFAVAPWDYLALAKVYLHHFGFFVPALALPLLVAAPFLDRRRPFSGMVELMRRSAGPLATFIVLSILFLAGFTTFKLNIPHLVPFYADPMLATLDEWIHAGPPWARLHAIDPGWFTTLTELVYMTLWFFQWFAVALFAAFNWHDRRHQRYLWALALTIIIVGTVLATAFSSVGPVFYGDFFDDGRFAGLTSLLDQKNSLVPHYSGYLLENFRNGTPALGTGISAMPSVHVAVATLNALYLSSFGRWQGVVGWTFALLILLCSVYTGWHYALDGYLSMLVVGVIWRRTRFLAGRPVQALSSISQSSG